MAISRHIYSQETHTLSPSLLFYLPRILDLENVDGEAASSDTIVTDSGVGSKTEVDTL